MLIVNTYQGYSGEWVTAFMVSCTFLLLSQNDKSETFKIVYWIIQITNIISLMFYLFAVLDVNIGYTIVPYYTGVTTVSYYKFGIFAILRQGFSQLRLCGVFNEPGGLGTICAFLFITTFPNSKTWEKIVLLATIAVTFSLAGYLLVFIYVGLYLIKKNKKFIILIPIIGYLFFIMPTIDFGNETLNYIARRFALTDKGLVGDNRYGSAFENFYQDFLTSNKVLFGYGYMYPMSLNVSTYKALIIQFGIVGFIYYIGLIAFMAIKYAAKDKDCILLLILFLISIYQRPLAVSSLYGFVILFGGIDYIKVQKQKTAKAEDMGKVPT